MHTWERKIILTYIVAQIWNRGLIIIIIVIIYYFELQDDQTLDMLMPVVATSNKQYDERTHFMTGSFLFSFLRYIRLRGWFVLRNRFFKYSYFCAGRAGFPWKNHSQSRAGRKYLREPGFADPRLRQLEVSRSLLGMRCLRQRREILLVQ